MNKELDDIADDFELLGDWDQRYQYLIELGEQLEEMPAEEKIDTHRVMPCMSKVWVYAFTARDNRDNILFHGDCETAIIKGVVALLVKVFSGKSTTQISKINIDTLFERIQLAENLSPNRHVGIYAIVEVMKQQVKNISAD